MPFQQGGWARGNYRCDVMGCAGAAEISVITQLSTPGGRTGRVQVSARAVRVCIECLNKYIANTQPAIFRKGLMAASAKVQEVLSQRTQERTRR